MAKAKEPKKIWDNYKVIGEVQKSDSIKLVVAAASRDGVKYVNIREFYKRKVDNQWMPGRDGITVPVSIAINKGAEFIDSARILINLILEANAEAASLADFDADNAVYYTPKGE